MDFVRTRKSYANVEFRILLFVYFIKWTNSFREITVFNCAFKPIYTAIVREVG